MFRTVNVFKSHYWENTLPDGNRNGKILELYTIQQNYENCCNKVLGVAMLLFYSVFSGQTFMGHDLSINTKKHQCTLRVWLGFAGSYRVSTQKGYLASATLYVWNNGL